MIIQAKVNQFSYPINIVTNVLKSLPKEILKFTKSKKVFVIIDHNLIKKYGKYN